MARINIPFNAWSEERLATGQKLATSRNKKYGEKGDYFIVKNKKYILKEVLKLPLWFVRDFLWYVEGAKSPMEFVEIWEQIHPKKGLVENDIVYTHFFFPEKIPIYKKWFKCPQCIKFCVLLNKKEKIYACEECGKSFNEQEYTSQNALEDYEYETIQ